MKYLILTLGCLNGLITVIFSQPVNHNKISVEFGVGGNFSGLYNATAPHPYFINNPDRWVPSFYSSENEDPVYHEYKMKPFEGMIFNLAPQLSLVYHNSKKFDYFINISFKKRGIDFKRENKWQQDNIVVITDTVKEKIINNYADIAAGVRYFFKGKKIKPYVFLAIYSGLLMKEKLSLASSKLVNKTFQSPSGYWSYGIIEDQKPAKPNGTQKIDYGIIAGFGAEFKMSEQWGIFFRTSVQVGMHKTDRYNNNDYRVINRPAFIGEGATYYSRNYYGFSSKSRYLSIEPAAGLSWFFK
jgi:Outer membrane protein beta-barrel domain